MELTFTHTLLDRTTKGFQVLYKPDDTRLDALIRNLDNEHIKPDTPLKEVRIFIEERAPLFEWEQRMRVIDPVYGKEMNDSEARGEKSVTVITL